MLSMLPADDSVLDSGDPGMHHFSEACHAGCGSGMDHVFSSYCSGMQAAEPVYRTGPGRV